MMGHFEVPRMGVWYSEEDLEIITRVGFFFGYRVAGRRRNEDAQMGDSGGDGIGDRGEELGS